MKVAIVGVGLIGGSFALVLKDKGICTEVIGVDNSEKNRVRAMELGLIDRVMTLEEAVGEADLIVLATPVDSIPLLAVKVLNRVNERQKHVLADKVRSVYPDLTGRRIAVWGLSFKPDTDDMREAASLVTINDLLAAGATVKVFDPVAMDECRRRLGDRVEYADDMYDAADGADALLLVTEWKQFRLPFWSVLKRIMRSPVVVDGRNIYVRKEVEAEGFRYFSIGR